MTIGAENRKVQTETVNIGDRAIDNLRFIRETMERSTVFTSVPGYGGVLMGATAVAAAIIASVQTSMRMWLVVWLVEAVLAFAIGWLAMWHKTKQSGASLFGNPAKRLWLSALPPMIGGLMGTVLLYRLGYFDAMIPVWILTYGAAVVCGGAFSVKPVPIMGWCFLAAGSISCLLPPEFHVYAMAATFGLLHIIFGFIIGRRYGG
jgi:hypothetical protein